MRLSDSKVIVSQNWYGLLHPAAIVDRAVLKGLPIVKLAAVLYLLRQETKQDPIQMTGYRLTRPYGSITVGGNGYLAWIPYPVEVRHCCTKLSSSALIRRRRWGKDERAAHDELNATSANAATSSPLSAERETQLLAVIKSSSPPHGDRLVSFAYYRHCITIKHCASLYNADILQVKRQIGAYKLILSVTGCSLL